MIARNSISSNVGRYIICSSTSARGDNDTNVSFSNYLYSSLKARALKLKHIAYSWPTSLPDISSFSIDQDVLLTFKSATLDSAETFVSPLAYGYKSILTSAIDFDNSENNFFSDQSVVEGEISPYEPFSVTLLTKSAFDASLTELAHQWQIRHPSLDRLKKDIISLFANSLKIDPAEYAKFIPLLKFILNFSLIPDDFPPDLQVTISQIFLNLDPNTLAINFSINFEIVVPADILVYKNTKAHFTVDTLLWKGFVTFVDGNVKITFVCNGPHTFTMPPHITKSPDNLKRFAAIVGSMSTTFSGNLSHLLSFHLGDFYALCTLDASAINNGKNTAALNVKVVNDAFVDSASDYYWNRAYESAFDGKQVSPADELAKAPELRLIFIYCDQLMPNTVTPLATYKILDEFAYELVNRDSIEVANFDISKITNQTLLIERLQVGNSWRSLSSTNQDISLLSFQILDGAGNPHALLERSATGVQLLLEAAVPFDTS